MKAKALEFCVEKEGALLGLIFPSQDFAEANHEKLYLQ